MYYLVFISLLDQSFKNISVIQKLKSARVRTHQKRPLQVSYRKLVLISCLFPLNVQESRPFRKTGGINWNVQRVRLTKRGLTFSNNPDGSAYQPIFPYPFSDQSSKLHTRLGGNYVIIT